MVAAKDILYYFLRNERGAVSVDWIVLSASVIGLAIVVFTVIADPIAGSLLDGTKNAISSVPAPAPHSGS